MSLTDDLRQLTGVSEAQYTIDDVTYWTDDQLAAVLTAQDEDIHGAAAIVFTSWAAALATAYDVTMDGQELSRSQMSDRLMKLAAQESDRAASGTDSVTGIKSIPTTTEPGQTHESSGPWPGFESS